MYIKTTIYSARRAKRAGRTLSSTFMRLVQRSLQQHLCNLNFICHCYWLQKLLQQRYSFGAIHLVPLN